MSKPPLSPHDHIQKLIHDSGEESDLNEADTRHQIIDVLLHDVLCWPRSAVKCEEYIAPGYADYVLFGTRERRLIIVEAKREGKYFEVPANIVDGNCQYVAVKTLLTSDDVKEAMVQVRTYCLDKGCEHAAITNGRQWIFFRTFSKNRDWTQLQAFVVNGLEYFDANFTQASNFFSYSAITEQASLLELFGEGIADHRPRYFAKEKVTAYDHEVRTNRLAPSMRPLIVRYFGRIDVEDSEFMEKCYVNSREYRTSELNVKQLIHDSLSPYFRDYNIKEFFDDVEGGELGARISSSARERKTKDVIVLFGGKGCGKSTFVNRLLFRNPPVSIEHFSQIVVVDLLECPETKEDISSTVWGKLCEGLDSGQLLNKSRGEILNLFEDRFAVAQSQDLAGLNKDSDSYNLRLNELVSVWKKDVPYCCIRLADYWKTKRKGVVVVIDNTDQFSLDNQDYCFTLAHDISSKLDCLVVISIREERFHFSRIHGMLDAFQNSGFHLECNCFPEPELRIGSEVGGGDG